MHNGKMNAIMLAIVWMESANATLVSKDTNVKLRVSYCTTHLHTHIDHSRVFISALEDSNLDLIVYAGNPANPSQKYSLDRNVTCAIDEFPVELENLVSGQAFGRPIACGGNSLGGSAVNQCYIYRHQTWLPEVSLMVPRSQAAGTVINNGVSYFFLYLNILKNQKRDQKGTKKGPKTGTYLTIF